MNEFEFRLCSKQARGDFVWVEGVAFFRGQHVELRFTLLEWLEQHGGDDYGHLPGFERMGVYTFRDLISEIVCGADLAAYVSDKRLMKEQADGTFLFTDLDIVMVLVLSIVDNCAYEIRGVDGRLLFCTDSGSPSITRILYEEPLRRGGVGHFLGCRSRPCRVHQPCRARVRGGGLSLTNGDELPDDWDDELCDDRDEEIPDDWEQDIGEDLWWVCRYHRRVQKKRRYCRRRAWHDRHAKLPLLRGGGDEVLDLGDSPWWVCVQCREKRLYADVEPAHTKDGTCCPWMCMVVAERGRRKTNACRGDAVRDVKQLDMIQARRAAARALPRHAHQLPAAHQEQVVRGELASPPSLASMGRVTEAATARPSAQTRPPCRDGLTFERLEQDVNMEEERELRRLEGGVPSISSPAASVPSGVEACTVNSALRFQTVAVKDLTPCEHCRTNARPCPVVAPATLTILATHVLPSARSHHAQQAAAGSAR